MFATIRWDSYILSGAPDSHGARAPVRVRALPKRPEDSASVRIIHQRHTVDISRVPGRTKLHMVIMAAHMIYAPDSQQHARCVGMSRREYWGIRELVNHIIRAVYEPNRARTLMNALPIDPPAANENAGDRDNDHSSSTFRKQNNAWHTDGQAAFMRVRLTVLDRH